MSHGVKAGTEYSDGDDVKKCKCKHCVQRTENTETQSFP